MGLLVLLLQQLTMFLFVQGWWSFPCSRACLQVERMALLQIKQSFKFDSESPLYSWGIDADCCNWKGIGCHSITCHVEGIDISYGLGIWDLGDDQYLNASLFLPFQKLNSLSLEGYGIVGCVENEGFERLSQLGNLKYLDLSYNKFNNITIFSSLSGLSSLKSLHLSSSQLKGWIHIGELNNLRSLEELDLSWNEIEGFRSFHGEDELLKLSNLTYLNLDGNRFDNRISSSLGALSSLRRLAIGSNQLKGAFNTNELNNLRSLEELDLSWNEIEGFRSFHGEDELLKLSNLTYLNLDGNRFDNRISSSLGALSSLMSLNIGSNQLKGAFNMNVLNNLRSLETLDLSKNEIEGFKSFHGEDELLKLSNLTQLNLCGNRFDNRISSSLGALSSLRSLNIESNQLKGAFNMNEWEAFNNLQELYLDENEITELVLPKAFPNLQRLFLNGNKITELIVFPNPKDSKGFGNLSLISLSNITTNYGRSFPLSLLQSLVEFPNLRTLYLTDNNFEGTKLPQAPLPLKNLEELDSSSSILHNSFFKTVGRMTNLRSLRLDHCRLNGTIPTTQGLCELKNLRDLYISNNDLTGILPWCLANLTSLRYLDLSFNHFIGDISSSPLISLTSIETLSLLYNQFQIPISLSPFLNHSKLIRFEAGSNSEILVEPDDHHLNPPKFQLKSLDLSGPGKCGTFPKFLFYQYNLIAIDLSNLKLTGGLPNWLLENNTNLGRLHLANNSLSGHFQLPKNHHSQLSYLDISDNYLDNHIPKKIGTYFPNLIFLYMSHNDFVGTIPSSLSSLPLFHLSLSHNSFQGSFEDALNNSFGLTSLDLSHNRLTGRIPKWIGEISNLYFLLLGHNNLEGRIPIQLCKLDTLKFLDLSHNNFSGHILPCLRFISIVRFVVPLTLEITTKGISYSFSIRILKYMFGIDLSHNNLTGEIPVEIGNLNQIQLLNLSYNFLIGSIPQTFSNLSQVESLDLSNNNLSGKIPPQLIELHTLSVFSVAHNNLSGKTPEMVAQFSTFNESSYVGNPFLCGPPLPINCIEKEEQPSSSRTSTSNEEENSFMDTKVFYASFFVTYIMVLLGIVAVLYINPNWRRTWFCFIEKSINNCYYFFVDNFLVSFGFKGWKSLV